MHITGFPDGPPLRPGLGMTDMSTGLLTHGAILAALHARHTTGLGQKISTSLFETQLSLLTNVGTSFLNMGTEGQRHGAAHPQIVPYNTYQIKEGWIALGANSDRQFRILCQRLGKAEWDDDPAYSSNAARVERREEVDGIVASCLKEKTMDEVLKLLEGSGLAHGPVNTVGGALGHPQAVSRDMVQSVGEPRFEGGMLNLIGPAAKFSETPAEIRSRAPGLGEHTADVLKEVGYSVKEIEMFKRQGVT